MKQKLINFFESTGLSWFVPVTKLIFADEPGVQLKEIVRMLGLPALAMIAFFATWSFMATKIKTSVGQLPGPMFVWSQAKAMWNNHKSENVGKSEFKILEDQRVKFDELLSKRREYESAGKATEAKKVTAQINAELDRVKIKSDSYVPLIKKYSTIHAEAKKEKQDEIDAVRDEYIEAKFYALDENGKTKLDPNGKPKLNEKAASQIAGMSNYRVAVLEGNLANVYQTYHSKFKSLVSKIEKIEGYAAKDLEYAAMEKTPALEKKIKTNEKKRNAFEKQLSRANEYNGNGSIVDYIKLSIITVMFGFIIAAIIAIPVGILCGLSPSFMTALNPIIQVFRPVSPLAWVLITITVVDGIFVGDNALEGDILKNNFLHAGITVALCSLWATLSNTALGVSSVDPDHLNVAKVLKLGWFDRVFKIVIPSAIPFIFTGLRITLGVGWMVLIVSEMMATSHGLGWYIDMEYQNNKAESLANIIVCIFIIGIIGFFLDRIMFTLQKLVSFTDEVSA